MENLNQLTPSELRKDYYENCLTINFQGELISYDRARELYGSYSIVDDTEKCAVLKSEMKRVKTLAKELYPDEASK